MGSACSAPSHPPTSASVLADIPRQEKAPVTKAPAKAHMNFVSMKDDDSSSGAALCDTSTVDSSDSRSSSFLLGSVSLPPQLLARLQHRAKPRVQPARDGSEAAPDEDPEECEERAAALRKRQASRRQRSDSNPPLFVPIDESGVPMDAETRRSKDERSSNTNSAAAKRESDAFDVASAESGVIGNSQLDSAQLPASQHTNWVEQQYL